MIGDGRTDNKRLSSARTD